MSQNGQTHFKNLAANAWFGSVSDRFGTLCIKGLKPDNYMSIYCFCYIRSTDRLQTTCLKGYLFLFWFLVKKTSTENGSQSLKTFC